MQRPISNKIQFGDTHNPAKDYGGASSIDGERNLENLIGKVEKVGGFQKAGKADGDLARYLPNILPVTRQNQVAGHVPRKAYERVMYSDKKIVELLQKILQILIQITVVWKQFYQFSLLKKLTKQHKSIKTQ